MLVIMISTFINTAFMRLIVNGRFKHAPFPFNKIGVDQEFPDFTQDWYQYMPYHLIQTMFIQALMPWIMVIGFGILRMF